MRHFGKILLGVGVVIFCCGMMTDTNLNPNEPWEVHYTVDYHTKSAAGDGSVTEWEDGYFIAHNWSTNGKMIAIKPKTVIVDGEEYQFVSSKVVSTNTKWNQIEEYVHENNGIGFQTCTKNGNLVTHYEPVED